MGVGGGSPTLCPISHQCMGLASVQLTPFCRAWKVLVPSRGPVSGRGFSSPDLSGVLPPLLRGLDPIPAPPLCLLVPGLDKTPWNKVTSPCATPPSLQGFFGPSYALDASCSCPRNRLEKTKQLCSFVCVLIPLFIQGAPSGVHCPEVGWAKRSRGW